MTDIAALEYKRLVVGGDRFVLNREHCTSVGLTNQEQKQNNIRQRRRLVPDGHTRTENLGVRVRMRTNCLRWAGAAAADSRSVIAGGAGDFTNHPLSPAGGVPNGAPSVCTAPYCRRELPPRRRFISRSEYAMPHPLDEPDGQADPASLTLSGLRESVVCLNEDSTDGTFDMLARALAANKRLMREIDEIFRLRLSERRNQRLSERSAQ